MGARIRCVLPCSRGHRRPVRMRLTHLALVLALTAHSFAAGASAQLPDLPAEARKRLDHHVGEWNVRTEFLGRNGGVVRTSEATDTARYVIPGRVVELATVANEKIVSRAWMFYNTTADEFTLTSVDPRGDHWVLTGGLDEYVITSAPRPHPRGGTLMIRFTHVNIELDSFEALMEMSRDGGETWFPRSRQYLTRQE